MNLLVIGSTDQAGECQRKFGDRHAISSSQNLHEALRHFSSAEVILDFFTPEEPSLAAEYPRPNEKHILFDTSAIRLAEVVKRAPWLEDEAFGFCGLTTLVNRELMEIAVLSEVAVANVKQLCERLGTEFRIVADQAGMVTPRVLCMIINEAYYTLEEGTASREDIDLAMKLGTNYPYGPFEWADRIGLKKVIRVLQASGRDSGDMRYEVCPLLMRQAGI